MINFHHNHWYFKKFSAILHYFASSWNTSVVDGHDVEALCKAFYDASTVKGRPTCILAKTFKGKGIPGIKKDL